MNIQKLRDMNLHAVADELEQLRAFKEAAEMQEPVAVMYKTGGALTKAECIDVEIFDICCRVETPLYAKPVPADKPAVAVPDGFREIVEAVAHIGVDFGYGNFALSQEHIEKARALLEAAPSHRQQSARPTDDELWDQTLAERDTYHDWADKLADAIADYFGEEIGEHSSANSPWDQALFVISEQPPILTVGLEAAAKHIEKKAARYHEEHGNYDPSTGGTDYPGDGADYYNNLIEIAEEIRLLSADHCPSHESEQGGNDV